MMKYFDPSLTTKGEGSLHLKIDTEARRYGK